MCRASWIWAFAAVMMVAPSCAWAGEPADRERAIVERMEAMQREAKQLREQGKVELAEQLLQKARQWREQLARAKRAPARENDVRAAIDRRRVELEDQLADARRKGMREKVAQLERARAELQRDMGLRERDAAPHEIEMMERKVHELREQGKVDQAEQVRRELERMVARLEHQEIRGRAPERREPRPEDRERAELERRLHHIHAAIENLEAIGMRDVVERLVDEANEIERALRGPRPEPRPEDREREELEQRLQHIRVAAENLNAIGMHDVVERLEAEGREIEQALHGREHGPGEVPPEVLEHIHHSFAELTERVEQLTRHLEEVTKAVERLQRNR